MLKKIIKDALPTMIALTLSGMYSVVDGIFIGRATGDVGLAAINLAWPITAVITALGIGIGSGGSVQVSHFRGMGEAEQSRRAGNNTLTLLLLGGVAITVLLWFSYPDILKALGAEGEIYREAARYSQIIAIGGVFQVLGAGILPLLRNREMSLGAMVSMVTGLCLNIFLNYYLMFEMEMGIQGAALGTVAAQAAVVLVSMGFLENQSRKRHQPLGLSLEKKLSIDTARLGLTAFGMSLAPSITLMFTNWQCLKYGGEKAVACYAVISYITFPVQYMLSGIGEGTQPLMSFYHGAGKADEVQKIRKTAGLLTGAVEILAFGLTVLLSGRIGGWFGLSEAAAEMFLPGLWISGTGFLALGFVKLNLSGLNATLQIKKAICLTYAESLVVAPILLYLLPVFLGLIGIWCAFPVTYVVMLTLSGFWMKSISIERRKT